MEKQIISKNLLTELRQFFLTHQSPRFWEIEDEGFRNFVAENSEKYQQLFALVATDQAVIK